MVVTSDQSVLGVISKKKKTLVHLPRNKATKTDFFRCNNRPINLAQTA